MFNIPCFPRRVSYRKQMFSILCVAGILVFGGFHHLYGQMPTPLEQQLELEEERIVDILEETEWRVIPAKPTVTYDWGGWLTTTRYTFEEFDRTDTLADAIEGATMADVRLWTKVFMPNGNTVYVRVKNQFSTTDWGGVMAAREETDNDGPHVDMAYITLPGGDGKSVKVGRQYFRLGRGLVLSNVLDGIKVKKHFIRSTIEAYYARTKPHDNNVDTSVPGWDLGSERHFYGFSSNYRLNAGREWYTYFLWEEDKSKEKPENPDQAYDYDAFYLGIGTRGSFTKTITYWGEMVRQKGEAPVSGTNTTTRIDASAFTLGARWLPQIDKHPTLTLELLQGSGDTDRGSVTNAFGGKQTGTTDNNFLHFSAAGLGNAFSPRLSNLRSSRITLTVKPLEGKGRWDDLMISLVRSRYRKVRSLGAISELMASEPSRDVGTEDDLYISFKITDDVRANLVFGRFSPGSAFPVENRAKTNYVSVGISCTF